MITPGSKRNLFTKKPSPFIFFEQPEEVDFGAMPKITPKFTKDFKLPWERGGSMILK